MIENSCFWKSQWKIFGKKFFWPDINDEGAPGDFVSRLLVHFEKFLEKNNRRIIDTKVTYILESQEKGWFPRTGNTADYKNFHDSFLSYLAGTANYEVIPTEIDVGEYLQEEHYTSVKKECQKLGAKILYTYKVGKLTVILNPNSLRTVIVQEDEEAH